MRKYLVGALLALSVASLTADDCCATSNSSSCCTLADCKDLCNSCDCKATGQSFFSITSPWQPGRPEYETLFHHDRLRAREEGRKGAVQIVPFGGRSTNWEHLAAFFNPVCKTVLNVAENPAATDVDILSRNFNITNVNFASKISFKPKHRFAGVALHYKQGFAERQDGKLFWFDISLPIMNVKNSMNLCEVVSNTGTPLDPACAKQDIVRSCCSTDCSTDCSPTATFIDAPVANMIEAFKQSAWQYGRIDDSCTNGKTALASFDMHLGYEIVHSEGCHLESYFGFSAPTGNKVKSKVMFEPIVGNNHHFSVQMGTYGEFKIWQSKERDDRDLWLDMSLHGAYLVRNTQTRLVDLVGKPWSRFMRVYANADQANEAATNGDECLHTPGVNVFALDMTVHPGFQRIYNFSLVYNSGGFQGEAGYNFFYRCPECVKLKCPWEEGPALVSYEGYRTYECDGEELVFQPALGLAGGTDPVQIINNNFGDKNTQAAADYTNSIIKAKDLNLNSAAHPGMATHNVFASIGYRWDDRNFPPFIGLGGSYEFSRDNIGLNRWTLWGKLGMSF